MKSFVQFLAEMSTADQVAQGFKELGKGVGAGVSDMNDRYARRILAGESPDQVLAGMKPNGAVWTSVMNRVKQLQGQTTQPQATPQQSSTSQVAPQSDPSAAPRMTYVKTETPPQSAAAPAQSQPTQPPAGSTQLSISRLEQQFGIKPGRLELVDGGQYVVVKNKVTGGKEFVKKDGNMQQGLDLAIGKLF